MLAATEPAPERALRPLSELLADAGAAHSLLARIVAGDADTPVAAVRHDSRRVRPGDCFVAVRGLVADANTFIPAALKAGASAIVYDHGRPRHQSPQRGAGAVWVEVADSRRALALLAASAAGHPDRRLTMVGVTGTSGKTTTTYLLEAAARSCGRSPGVLGTINARLGSTVFPIPHTTPEAPDIHDLLAAMVGAGADLVAMEVSSHALALERVTGIGFDVAVFTNLGRDHLDFHSGLDDYAAAKARLFAMLGKPPRERRPVAVLNADDPFSTRMADAAKLADLVTFGLESPDAPWRAEDISLPGGGEAGGTSCTVIGPGVRERVTLRLLGRFNVANLLGALAASVAAGLPAPESLRAMAECSGAPGRFELVPGPAGAPRVVVDYAHKPDGLAAVLRTARALSAGRVLAVFGCGGDRDRGKRPIMGGLVGELADRSWVTSDNPRSEDPDAIIREIVEGLRPVAERSGHRYSVEPDRARAIAAAVAEAGPQDLVVIAGKGHEPYQIFADRTIHFDDREHARWALERRQP